MIQDRKGSMPRRDVHKMAGVHNTWGTAEVTSRQKSREGCLEEMTFDLT